MYSTYVLYTQSWALTRGPDLLIPAWMWGIDTYHFTVIFCQTNSIAVSGTSEMTGWLIDSVIANHLGEKRVKKSLILPPCSALAPNDLVKNI